MLIGENRMTVATVQKRIMSLAYIQSLTSGVLHTHCHPTYLPLLRAQPVKTFFSTGVRTTDLLRIPPHLNSAVPMPTTRGYAPV